MPRLRRYPEDHRLLPRPPGRLDGMKHVDREFGGVVMVTCGVCGAVEHVEVRPNDAHHRVVTITERSLRRDGWVLHPTWGWVQKRCLKRIRRMVRAGHVQLSLL